MFGNNPISTYLHAVIAYLPLVFVAIITVIIASALAVAAKALIENSLSGMSYAKVLGNVASGLILAFGIIAALDQLHVASNVVNAVLYAALVGVVAVGGGIRTMSRRWEAVADRYDEEKPKIAEPARNAPYIKDQARQAKDALSSQYAAPGTTHPTPPPASPN